jgi:orsellinic acid C2-O-methyltransferase
MVSRGESIGGEDRLTTRMDTFAKLVGIVSASWMSQAACVAAELRIADLLAGGPKRVDELAKAAGCHAPSLARFMRALTSFEICVERNDGSFELTPMGSLLRADAPNSLRSWTIMWGKHQWPVWGNLLFSVRTGESARKLVRGTEGFEHLARNPETAAVFNEAMVEITRFAVSEVVRAYDFTGSRRIVDVGGGYGDLLAAILKAFPQTRGAVFDMPHALDGARQRAEKAGVADRCEFVAGDFFESVPRGSDVYVLKNIIHDWNDERSAVVLRNCRKAMSQDAKLLLVERIFPARVEASEAHQDFARADLNMLLGPGGHERTETEFRNLLGAAGFGAIRIIPTATDFSIIESVAS